MAEQALRIEVKGLDKLLAKLDKFPKEIAAGMSQAGDEAANNVVLNTRGLKTYPPETAANRPPTPYYIRHRGMQYKSYNAANSEKLRTLWVVKREGWNTRIGNSASYAKWVHGDETQAGAMARIGWKKLFGTAKEKLNEIQKVYQGWVNKIIRDLGL